MSHNTGKEGIGVQRAVCAGDEQKQSQFGLSNRNLPKRPRHDRISPGQAAMRRCFAWCERMLHPGGAWVWLLSIVSAALLYFIFTNDRQSSPMAYAAYGLSVYSLAILVLHLPELIQRTKTLASQNKHGKRYLTDTPFRVRVSLNLSLIFNLAYAGYKLAAGIVYASAWFGAVAMYYMVLSIMRYSLLRHMRREEQDLYQEYLQYRYCGCLLFVLDFALVGVFFQIIHSGEGYSYPGHLIYVVAAYALYSLISSIVSLIEFRKLHRPAISAVKIIGFSAAMVSMFTLETALYASFGGDERIWRIIIRVTGVMICLIVFGLAVHMVIRSGKKLAAWERERRQDTP